ncbi:cleavage/polyadenylation factor CFT1 [Rhodotorula paludigena]|uniref:cleavage/polyadenylation factor CFT1 n=1 Tax=Rhodotorula paludigena TaxID=86838 RepID=UPI003172526B
MAPLTALYKQAQPPSGARLAVAAQLVPAADDPAGCLVAHLVTANNNVLHVYAVTQPAPPARAAGAQPRLEHVLTRRLHGTVANLSRVRTLATKHDGCDRILIGFLDAKLSLMEWSPSAHDLVPVSLHTFEKLPQVAEDRQPLMAVDPASRLAALLLPTNSGGDGTLALLPFFAEELDLEGLGMDREGWEDAQGKGGSIPYAPSHLLPLSSLTAATASATAAATTAARSSTLPSATSSTASNAFLPGAPPPIRNVVSIAFLPGFTEPTLALLYAPDWTWSGRLEHLAHNYLVSLVTLTTDLSSSAVGTSASAPATRAVVIATSPPLPYSSLFLTPCPAQLGGVLVTTANGILHVDQSGRIVACPTNAWLARDYPPGRTRPTGLDGNAAATLREALEDARVQFVTHPADDDAAAEAEGTDPPQALVWCRSGAVLSASFELTGRTISAIRLDRIADGASITGGGASTMVRISGGAAQGGGLVFVGSETGASALCRWSFEGADAGKALEAEVDADKADDKPTAGEPEPLQPASKANDDVEMDFDEDDIYGDSTPAAAAPSIPSAAALASLATALTSQGGNASNRRVVMQVCDTQPGYGAIRSMVTGLIDDESPAELVAATGAGKTAGLTIFHRTLFPTSRRSLHLPASAAPPDPALDETEGQTAFTATTGLWRLQLAPTPAGQAAEVWVASDRERTAFYRPFPGATAATLDVLQLVHLEEEGGPALAASTMNAGQHLVTVHRDAIRVFDTDLNDVQQLALPHPLHPVAHHAHVSTSSTGNYLVLHAPVSSAGARARTAPLVYVWDPQQGQLVLHQALQGEAEEARRNGAHAAVFADHLAIVPVVRPAVALSANEKKEAEASAMDDDDEVDLYGGGVGDAAKKEAQPGGGVHTAAIVQPQELGGSAQDSWVWAAEVDAKGDLRLRLLPSGDEIFACSAVTLFPEVLEDGSLDRSIAEDIDEDDVKVDRVTVAYVGPRDAPHVHLMILLTNGLLAIYEAVASMSAVSPVSPNSSSRPPRLAARFVKTHVRYLPSAPARRKGTQAAVPDLPPPRRDFCPFSHVGGMSGVLITGEEAVWVLKGPHGSTQCIESSDRGVYGVTELGGGQQHDERGGAEEGNEFAMQTRAGLAIARVSPSLVFDSPLAFTHVPKDRVYGHLAFDIESGLYVGATLNDTRFVAFDDEGQPMWKEQDPDLIEPSNYRSTLELVAPGNWAAIHGYEFRQNEFVTSLKSVSLASKSAASGQRDFVAAGTAVYRAEDLATKGGIYVFEVVPIQPHPSAPEYSHELRLLFFEDAKAAVNNVCDLNGYLFMSMGQKLYARAFEQDEFLLAIGFLDVGVHVTSLTALKNFLLIGDEQQSLSLVAFQEDPYKLVLLGRDYRPSRVDGANFIVNEGKVAFISNDDGGVLRLFEYDPTNIASFAGQRLLCRTEFHAGTESIASILFAKHVANEDAKQNGILYGGLDGSLASLVPVRDAVFRRLQALQTIMIRHVLHFGGLNPRGYRIVKNDSVSRAIVKGILDGDLLVAFEMLPLDAQTDLAKAVNTDVDTLLANLRTLRGFE